MKNLVAATILVAGLLSATAGPVRGSDLLLYDFDTRTFLGCVNCPQYDRDSICNRYGDYGSRYSRDSIWNRYGEYGNRYSGKSPWNRYSSSAPRIVSEQGGDYGQFSINAYSGFRGSRELERAYEQSSGDLETVRDRFCD